MIGTIVLIFAASCMVSAVFTALLCRVAPRIGLMDHPDGRRKMHDRSVPLGGGVAIFAATVLVVTVALAIPGRVQTVLSNHAYSLVILLAAATIIVLVGLADDRFHLRGRQKLLGQAVAAGILVLGGFVIERVGVFGWQIDLGLLAVPMTLFWFLGAINALNLLDGIDGLATMIGLILVAAISAMAGLLGKADIAIIGLAFAGSLLGFMRYNFPPARIFLGDTGSMLIGLVVGVLAMLGSLKGPGTVLLAAPLAVLAIPILDSTAAVLRRKLTGRSVYSTDRGHLHHRLLDLLGSNRKVLAWVAGCCAITSLAALGSVFWKNDLISLISCAGVVAVLLITGVFGRAEALLLASRLSKIGRSMVRPLGRSDGHIWQSAVRLQGSRQWELLWQMLTESADKLHLNDISLDVNLPAMREGYHASWKRSGYHDLELCWRMELPLAIDSQRVGRLLIAGQRNGEPIHNVLDQLLEMIGPFEEKLRESLAAVANEDSSDPTPEHALSASE